MKKPVAIVAGYIVRYPLGGMVLYHLHYLRGLERLGYDVVFVEHHGWSSACYDPRRNAMTDDPSAGLAELQRVFDKFGGGRWKWCYVDNSETYHGLSQKELVRFCRDSTLLLAIGTTTWVEEFRECRQRVFFDGDPGFTQFRMPAFPTPSTSGYASPYDFQFHFTAGERVGRFGCPVPTHGFHWQPSRFPIALELIQPRFSPAATTFTTVMSWSVFGDTQYKGDCYGSKNVEMLKLLDLPKRVEDALEIAVGGPDIPTQILRDAGWIVSDPLEATGTVEAYLDFIGRSRGEFSVAKEGYVKTRCGWFSERTANYLAMGKPAIVQDTGFSEFLPCGEGLFAFRNADEIVAATEVIRADYAKHCRAARRIAEEHFDASKILGAVLRRCRLPAHA